MIFDVIWSCKRNTKLSTKEHVVKNNPKTRPRQDVVKKGRTDKITVKSQNMLRPVQEIWRR